MGSREANSACACITLGHSGDVWRHDDLIRNLPSSLLLGATLRQIVLFSLDHRCKNIAFHSIMTVVSLLCHLLNPLLLSYLNVW